MDCPDCGEKTHRSRTRGIKEAMLKKFASTRYYRCSQCGWRGKVAPEAASLSGSRKLALLIWVAGVLLALVIGLYGVSRLSASVWLPLTAGARDRR